MRERGITIWIGAQLSPALAAWVNRKYDRIQARSVRAVGLRDGKDREIFEAAREAGAVVTSKDSDFLRLLESTVRRLRLSGSHAEIRRTRRCVRFWERCCRASSMHFR